MTDPPLSIGLVGLGTIGTGVVKILQDHTAEIAQRLGFSLELVHVADLDLETDRGVDVSGYTLSREWRAVVDDPEVDFVVELIGGRGVARELVKASLEAGKGVVTANKALLAHDGAELYALAVDKGCEIAFEAAVGGTIPVLRALREGLCADRIESLHGIVNGTCNYILTEMETGGEPYEACLKRAQDLGYAEADPTFDVNGMDSVHKLAILCGLAFGTVVHPEDIAAEGIERISSVDIEYARRFGLRIKLLAIAKQTERGIEARVHPTMIPIDSVLSGVDGSMNAVEVRGRMSGPTMYYGAGAGSLPTASAVVADLMELARNRQRGAVNRVPPLGTHALSSAALLPADTQHGAYYVRFKATDSPGVFARIAGALATRGISIASVLQEERHAERAVPIVVMTHESGHAELMAALAEIERMAEVRAPVQVIRIEREI